MTSARSRKIEIRFMLDALERTGRIAGLRDPRVRNEAEHDAAESLPYEGVVVDDQHVHRRRAYADVLACNGAPDVGLAVGISGPR